MMLAIGLEKSENGRQRPKDTNRHKMAQNDTKRLCLPKTSKRHKMFVPFGHFQNVQKTQNGTKRHKVFVPFRHFENVQKTQSFCAFWTFSKCPKDTKWHKKAQKFFCFEGTKVLCLLDILKTSKRHKVFVSFRHFENVQKAQSFCAF